ncbi:MAG: hypothetical protein JST75_09560 [Bacteroidetes bacterium]|nr:hypothetical protein [Bacteroidota bacterium]
MKNLLLRHNVGIRQQVDLLLATVSLKAVPAELILYKEWLVRELKIMQKQIDDNLFLLRKDNPALIPDVLSDTELLSQNLGFLNSCFVPPIHRSISSDIIGLKLLEWLHKAHPLTSTIPFAIADGSFSIYPVKPTLYYLPIVEQKGLLFLALFFHEFGHLLFAIHRPEMEKLVNEIQLAIEDLLRPAFAHNDEKNDEEWEKNAVIVTTWYKWAQELFCDAVGLVIGGESYLHAFSSYFQMGGRDEFFIAEEELKGHSHPITSIRIKFLIRRGKKLGYLKVAEKIEIEWGLLRKNYKIDEEYFGYFIDDYFEIVETIIGDMLTQSDPKQYDVGDSTPVAILNAAWIKFLEDPEKFPAWQHEQIEMYMSKVFNAKNAELNKDKRN